jgi:hypothetical protein
MMHQVRLTLFMSNSGNDLDKRGCHSIVEDRLFGY